MAYFFKEKNVIVVGGGDSALEESLFLTRFAKSVTIVHRRDEFRAGAILQDAVKENPKIKFILNTVLTEITGKEAVTGVQHEECRDRRRKPDADRWCVYLRRSYTQHPAIRGSA